MSEVDSHGGERPSIGRRMCLPHARRNRAPKGPRAASLKMMELAGRLTHNAAPAEPSAMKELVEVSKNKDFAFLAEFDAPMDVVRFRFESAMSAPYALSLLVHVRDLGTEVQPEAMLGARGTLRMLTTTAPASRCIHGVVLQAEELGLTEDGVLFELQLGPPLDRSGFRVQSRVFVEKTTRQIVDAVLAGDPMVSEGQAPDHADLGLDDAYVPAKELYEWRISEPQRIDDVAARPYCVQYEESDLSFLARLLEEEGIAYHFEHGADVVTLVFSDSDAGRRPLAPFDPLGPRVGGRVLDRLRLGGRMRPTKVQLTGFNWQKPRQDMTASAALEGGEERFVRMHPGNYPDAPEQGAPLAKAMLQRFQTEARYATAEGSCRLLDAGAIFALEHDLDRYRGEYLVTKTVLRGQASGELPPGYEEPKLPTDGPVHVRVECARRGQGSSTDESCFRPAQSTPKPRIRGTQTAIVTDDPDTRGAEIHVGGPPGNENGCVRVRFHWDVETERHDKEPTSCWVRVSQALAGAGGGSVWHPRVGTEVIVDFLDGDPDRPIVVGRVYNGEQPPAALGKGAATLSTFKSMSSPGGEVFNEFGFDDTAGKEQVKLHAGKDWNNTVGNDRSESVGNNSSSSVSVDRSEDTGANRATSVGGNNEESISGNETITVSGNQKLAIGGTQNHSVAGTRDLSVGGAHTVAVGPETYTVKGTQTVNVTAVKSENIGAVCSLGVGAAYNIAVGAAMTVSAGALYSLSTPLATISAPTYGVKCSSGSIEGADIKVIASGSLTLQGSDVSINGATITIGGGTINIKGGTVNVNGGTTNVAGGTTNVTGGSVNVN